MNEFLSHPTIPTLLMCLVSLWPVMRLYARVGLAPAWGLLLFCSLLVPLSGFLLAALPLALKAWPNFPKPLAPEKPVKLPI